MPITHDFHVLEAFESVFNNMTALQGTDPKLISISLKRLTGYYELTPASVEIIAYLLHFHPNRIAPSKLRIIAQNRGEYFEEVVRSLDDRRFIDTNHLSGGIVSSFGINDNAYKAFQSSSKYGMPYFEDCLKELATCKYCDIYGKKWFQRFTYSLDISNNVSLKTACVKLGVMELTTNLQMSFWALAANFIRHFTATFEWDDNSFASTVDIDFDAEMGMLAKHGLATVIPIEDDSVTRSEYLLSIEAAQALFYGHDEFIRYDEVAKLATIRKTRDIKKKDLFFSDEALEEINHLRTMLSQEGYERARKILIRKKHSPSIQSLLWGPPGTGKTESVRQLALESGRDIIQFDMSKVTGYGWGNTEKCYRALFRAYNYIASISKNTPILLLNEADAILSKRIGNVERAIDKSENTVTNILLEELENLNGILLATTNCLDSLDEAFDRRFLFKTELTKPDETARAKIWKSNIPELSDEEARLLAASFNMSGAQINNVVTKRDLAELYYTGDRGLPYIEHLCTAELSTENGTKGKRSRIGF